MLDKYGDATLSEWVAVGRPHPPPHSYKEALVREVAQKLSIRRFVETGFGWGRMVRAVIDDFDEVVSIESDQKLYLDGVEEFKDQQNVRLFRGDSCVLLPAIILELDGSCLFWLDAHDAGGSLVLSEIAAVLSRGKSGDGDVVMIDDVRCMGTEPGWPTLSEVCASLRVSRPEWNVTVERDIIVAHRPTNGVS